MAFWTKDKPLPIDERLCVALERLVALKEIELAAKGLTLYTDTSEGEISFTDDATLIRMEQEDAIRKQFGLPLNAPIGVIDPETGKEWTTPVETEAVSNWASGPGFGFGTGPEGAESPEPGTETERSPG